MADLTLTKNDSGFDINFTVLDAAGAAYDLTDHTVEFHVSDESYKNKISGACSILVAASGTCKYTVQDGDLNLDPGRYLGELQLTSGAKVISNPTKLTILIVDECG